MAPVFADDDKIAVHLDKRERRRRERKGTENCAGAIGPAACQAGLGSFVVGTCAGPTPQ